MTRILFKKKDHFPIKIGSCKILQNHKFSYFSDLYIQFYLYNNFVSMEKLNLCLFIFCRKSVELIHFSHLSGRRFGNCFLFFFFFFCISNWFRDGIFKLSQKYAKKNVLEQDIWFFTYYMSRIWWFLASSVNKSFELCLFVWESQNQQIIYAIFLHVLDVIETYILLK